MKYIDKINLQQALTVIFVGLALIYAVTVDNKDVAMAGIAGLVGYLGGVNTKGE